MTRPTAASEEAEEAEETERGASGEPPSPGRPSPGRSSPEPSSSEPPSGAALYRTAWWLYLVLAVVAVVWIGLRDGGLSPALLVDLEGPWTAVVAGAGLDLVIGCGAGLALLGSWRLGRRVLPRARELEEHMRRLLAGLDPGQAVALALLSGFAEELFFRGAVQGSFGLVVATVVFALLHTGPGPAFRLWTLFAAVAGLAFGLLVVWRGTLLPAIVAHVLVNGVNLRRLVLTAPDADGVDAHAAVDEPHGERDDPPGAVDTDHS